MTHDMHACESDSYISPVLCMYDAISSVPKSEKLDICCLKSSEFCKHNWFRSLLGKDREFGIWIWIDFLIFLKGPKVRHESPLLILCVFWCNNLNCLSSFCYYRKEFNHKQVCYGLLALAILFRL